MKFVLIESKADNPIEKTIVHYKNSRRNKIPWDKNKYEEKEILWFLGKHIYKVSNDGWDFYPSRFAENLDNGITVKVICEQLNQHNIYFPFEYFPSKNDCIIIKLEYSNPVVKGKSRPNLVNGISCIHNGEIWVPNNNFYDHNNYFQESKNGVIQYIV